MVLHYGDVWCIIEFILCLSCWWIASKKCVCVCAVGRARARVCLCVVEAGRRNVIGA